MALGEKVLFFIKSFGTWSDEADWAMAGQRLCLPASAHSFLALNVCTDGVHNELKSALERLKGKPHWLMIYLTAKAKGARFCGLT